MGARHLGELGTVHASTELTFGWFGLTVRVGETAGDLQFIEFIEHAMTLDADDQVEGMKAVMAYLHELVHPDDWDVFWGAAKANRQTFEDLMNVAKAIVEVTSGFPTGRPHASSGGRSTIKRKFKGGSSSQGRALKLLKGRPDLKMAVWQADQARRGA